MKNKTESKVTPHTPTPWESVEGECNVIIDSVQKVGSVAIMTGGSDILSKSNAAFIVKAVNSYESLRNSQDELVTMLKEEHEGYINEQYGEKSFKHKEKPCDVCEAIAKAEGKGA